MGGKRKRGRDWDEGERWGEISYCALLEEKDTKDKKIFPSKLASKIQSPKPKLNKATVK